MDSGQGGLCEREKFWLFGKPINKKLDDEMAELHRMVAEVDKKLKADQ